MATIRIETDIAAPAGQVWDAIRDYGALHTRLVPGFVVDTRLEGDSRLVTFGNGMVARERIVGLDDDARRFAYAVVSERLVHHSASNQVLPDGEGGCRTGRAAAASSGSPMCCPTPRSTPSRR